MDACRKSCSICRIMRAVVRLLNVAPTYHLTGVPDEERIGPRVRLFRRASQHDDPCGLLPSQRTQHDAWGSDELLCALTIRQAADDWRYLWQHGRVQFDDSHRFTIDDCITLVNWIFDDDYGVGDEGVLTLGFCCRMIGRKVSKFRSAMLKLCQPNYISELQKLDLPLNAEASRELLRRKAAERRARKNGSRA